MATSTTAVVIGTGSKSFVIETGKSLAPGQRIVAFADVSGDALYGAVQSYNASTGALAVFVDVVTGSNGGSSRSAWTLSLSAASFPYAVSTASSVDTLVQRTSAGDIAAHYVFATSYRQDSVNDENPTVSQVLVTNGSDGYSRKASLSHLLSSVYVDIAMLEMLAADAVNQAQFIGQGGNRFADSFDTTAYLATGGSTNMDTSVAGVIKPSTFAASSEDSGVNLGGDNLSDRLVWDTGYSLDNNRTVTKLGLIGQGRSYTFAILKRNSATSYDIVYQQSVTAVNAGGYEEFTLTTPFAVPSTGAYYVGVYYVGGVGQDTAVRLSSGGQLDATGMPSNAAGYAVTEFGSGVRSTPCTRAVYAAATLNMTAYGATLSATITPVSIKMLLMVEEVDSLTLNTDFIAAGSRDGGATWGNFSLTKRYTVGGVSLYESNDLDLSSHPVNNNPRWRIITANNKRVNVHAVALYWR